MLISINKTQTHSNSILFDNYVLDYELNNKELYFESSKYHLFLKSNYSENYINSFLKNFESSSILDVKNAFQKDGFWVIIDKKDQNIYINRDLSGLCSAYFYKNDDKLILSTNVHNIAQENARNLNREAVYQLLYFDFLWDGQTIYEGISQLKMGAELILDGNLNVKSDTHKQPDIIENNNTLSEEGNIRSLRQEIVKAHKPYLNDENIVFLSGGIDSVAMLIALNDLTSKEKIKNHSFKVKDTTQDETEYAKSIANHLDNEIKIIERDFEGEIDEEIFKNKILKMNNPYSGMWIFGNQISNTPNTTYYAGQDTRLHTPSLNFLDKIAFNIFELSRKGFKIIFKLFDVLLWPMRFFLNLILKFKNIQNKKFLGLRRASYIFNTKAYLSLVYFKVDRANLASYKLPLGFFKQIKKAYNISLKKANNKRELYNTIVSKKWTEQYVNDMRYMIDMVESQGGKLAMPFYDMDLAKFSATIPFDLSIKTMKGKAQFDDSTSTINKYVLRESLIDKIDKKTYLRSKAVSRTGHLIFTKGLDNVLKGIILKDISSNKSFVKEYELELFLERFLNNTQDWIMTDDKYLLKVYYTACMIVYFNKI